MSRPAFLDQEAPEGYVAGIGRGATGFTTSADTGAVRLENDFEDDEPKNDDERGLLARRGKSDAADEEADRIYEHVERRMAGKSREKSSGNALQLVQTQAEDQQLSQFVDLKRDLSAVTADQWAALPEVGDLTRRNKRLRLLEKQQQRFYAVPDSVLSSLGSTQLNFSSISHGKDKILSQRLDELLPQNSIETEAIEEPDAGTSSQIADANRTRLVLNSLRKTAPNKASSWIASIRLEEQANDFAAAKRLAVQACLKVPQSDELWLESIRIHQKSLRSSYECKSIANTGLKFNPRSVALWLKLYELEASSDASARRKVLMRALENLPHVSQLWEKFVLQEDDDTEKRKLLAKAVELCPLDWNLRYQLVQLSDYKESKALINEARKIMAGNPNIWVAALELEEHYNPEVLEHKLISMMKKALGEVASNAEESEPKTNWLEFARSAESAGHLKTCAAIVLAAFSAHESGDLAMWIHEAQKMSRSHKNAATFIYQAILAEHQNNTEMWMLLFDSLKQDIPSLMEHYKRAIELNPGEVLFRLMYAKDLWILVNNIEGAREVLQLANLDMSESEEIWLARIKLEIRNKQYKEAGLVFKLALEALGHSSPRIWYKYVHYERFMYSIKEVTPDKLREIVEDALDKFPENEKLNLQMGQILMLELGESHQARSSLSRSVKICPSSVALWTLLSNVEEFQFKNVLKARSTLDSALLKNPQSDILWVRKVCLELRVGDHAAAVAMCSRALQKFPTSPALWVLHLSLIDKLSTKKNSFLDALQKTNNASEVLVEIGKTFFLDGKYAKAEQWFQRSVDSEKENGDCWAWLIKVLKELGKKEKISSLLQSVDSILDDINKGDTWLKIKKNPMNIAATGSELVEAASDLL